ncbi:MAG: tRNA-modifying protein YgfZ [Gammaproteobacteria bacterium]|nr:tRNA-modifying protein YgfZ [Gammaproteobacteria bacterium]
MFIPQMINYKMTGLIRFNKGCYTGQEVVARIHYRGKLKRPMVLASINLEPDADLSAAGMSEGRTSERRIAAAGTPLYKPGSEQSIGNVVNCARDGDSYRLLVVVTSAAVDEGVHLADPAGPQLSFHDLPYPLPSD